MKKIRVEYPIDPYWMRISGEVRRALANNGLVPDEVQHYKVEGEYRVAEYIFKNGASMPSRTALERIFGSLEPSSRVVINFNVLNLAEAQTG